MMPLGTDEQIVRYLLDEMNGEERSALEEHLSREPSFFEVIASAEDDMIMRYVRGDLEIRLLPRFTEVYLNSPSKRARVEQARSLQQAVRDTARSRKPGLFSRLFAAKSPGFRVAMLSAAAILVLIAVLWPWWRNRPFSQQPSLQDTSQLRVSLSPGLVRGGAGVQISLPSGTRQVQFELTLPKQATDESYRVILKTPEKPDVWSGLAVHKRLTATVRIPANLLVAGDYTLELQGRGADTSGEDIAIYYLRVMK